MESSIFTQMPFRSPMPLPLLSWNEREGVENIFGSFFGDLALRMDARNFLHITVEAAFFAGFKNAGEFVHAALN